eukprot:CAMPEP_0185031876 /NCGR_PEP_ID=MMETSP1103-20130426/19566_1 /TAXON_ID=36769 /ORGANISM="Paraphysomonas bandaiensis, Strain Caron Lab Isolate" /LENGTH=523 /DNA_ID=CAMNT_0027567553 /DNA_START=319 /DNA_END=1890 /DNA_ORIENTATION=+
MTAPQKKAGAQGESVLDRMTDSMIEFGVMAENENWMEDGEDGGVKEEGDISETEDLPESGENLATDEEILELAKQLEKYSEEPVDNIDREMTRSEYEYHQRRLAAHRRRKNKRRIKTAAYMPSMRTRVYKEWAEAQTLKRQQTPEVWRREDERFQSRPATAAISDMITRQSTHLSEDPAERPLSSGGHPPVCEEGKARIDRCMHSPIKKLAPLHSLSAVGADTTVGDNQAMSTSRSVQLQPIPDPEVAAREIPPTPVHRPATSRPASRSISSRGGPTSPPPVAFPAANTDTIPSNNSAIVKFKSSREQMLDTLNLPSKEQRTKAVKRSMERLNIAQTQAIPSPKRAEESPTISSRRFETSQAPLSLTKLGIAPKTGTVSNVSPAYRRNRMKEVRSLRDQMLTTAGGVSMHASEHCRIGKDVLDPVKSFQKTATMAREAKSANGEDQVTDLISISGFFEKVGPDKFYRSVSKSFHEADDSFLEAIKSRRDPAITKADFVRVWADDALLHGRKLFSSMGGGFHFA